MDFTKNLEQTIKALPKGAFLTCKSSDIVNTMTIGWGFIGVMWNKPYFVVMVRPSRYTFKLLENTLNFTVSIPYETMKEELKICGSKSGTEINKGEIVNFIPARKVASPIVDGCNMYYECTVSYKQQLDKNNIPDNILNSQYQDLQHHYIYFGEIVDCYENL